MFCIPSPLWDTWSLILHPLQRMRCKHLLIIRELSALLHTTHEILHKSEGWGECICVPLLSGILGALFYIPSEGCGASTYSYLESCVNSYTQYMKSLIKARDGENVLYPIPSLGYLEPYFTSPPKDAVQAPTHN